MKRACELLLPRLDMKGADVANMAREQIDQIVD